MSPNATPPENTEQSVSLRDAAVKAQEALAFLVCCEASGESGRHHPVVVQAQTALREALEGHALISPDATPPTNAEPSVTFKGKFLTPHFTWVLSGSPPEAGYSMGPDRRLYRNGADVGEVLRSEWSNDVGGWWIHYRSWRGSPLDMGGR